MDDLFMPPVRMKGKRRMAMKPWKKAVEDQENESAESAAGASFSLAQENIIASEAAGENNDPAPRTRKQGIRLITRKQAREEDEARAHDQATSTVDLSEWWRDQIGASPQSRRITAGHRA